jgi:hypothetical protein
MLINISTKFVDSGSNTLRCVYYTYFDRVFLRQGIILQILMTKYTFSKHLGTALQMRTDISVVSYTRSDIFCTRDTIWKLLFFSKSRAISLQILNKILNKFPCAYLNMLDIIPVHFLESLLILVWAMQIYSESRAITFTKRETNE